MNNCQEATDCSKCEFRDVCNEGDFDFETGTPEEFEISEDAEQI